MKVAVLALPFDWNYGGILQKYALQVFLKQRGHDVWSIQRIVYKPDLIKKIKIKIKKTFLSESFKVENFVNQYVQKTEVIDSPNKYKLLDKYNFDAYIVGSDQVWRFKYTEEHKKEYFLDFVSDKNAKKIAFAASFGIGYWDADESDTKEISKLIFNFDGVSVREKSGIDLCNKYLGYNKAIFLYDPTLLHSADFYRKLYTGDEVDNSGKIGVYFLDYNEHKDRLVLEFEKQTKKRSFVIGQQKRKNYTFYPTVEQWLKDFDTADYIITDSFHGIAFSMMLNTEPIVCRERYEGQRISGFLSLIGEEHRYIKSYTDTDTDIDIPNKPVNFTRVNEILAAERKRIDEFLNSIFKK